MTEPADDAALEALLADERQVPAAGFRGALGRRVAIEDPGLGPRPSYLRLRVALYMAAGGAVGAVGALVALGGH